MPIIYQTTQTIFDVYKRISVLISKKILEYLVKSGIFDRILLFRPKVTQTLFPFVISLKVVYQPLTIFHYLFRRVFCSEHIVEVVELVCPLQGFLLAVFLGKILKKLACFFIVRSPVKFCDFACNFLKDTVRFAYNSLLRHIIKLGECCSKNILRIYNCGFNCAIVGNISK